MQASLAFLASFAFAGALAGCSSSPSEPSPGGSGPSAPSDAGAVDAGPSDGGGAGTSCTDVCAHATACSPGVTAGQCMASCAGFTEACRACLVSVACNAPKTACPACTGGGTPTGGGACTTSTRCNRSTDCPGSQMCNTKQGLCFDPSARCVGELCERSTDCANSETCNSATGRCN